MLLYAARIDTVGDIARGDSIRQAFTVSFAQAEEMPMAGHITNAVTIAAVYRFRRASTTA